MPCCTPRASNSRRCSAEPSHQTNDAGSHKATHSSTHSQTTEFTPAGTSITRLLISAPSRHPLADTLYNVIAMEWRCGHNHSHPPAAAPFQRMRLGIALTLALVIAELIAGFFAHSLALLSDAGHNWPTPPALGFSWYALSIARKPSNAAMTLGYHRAGILSALANALCLAIIALLIGWEAIDPCTIPNPLTAP